MTILKLKDAGHQYVLLKNIKSIRITLRNRSNDIRSLYSSGWRRVLEESGDKYLTMRVNGITTNNSDAEALLREYSMQNKAVECELLFNNEQEKMVMRCIIDLYEQCYEAGKFDSFSVTMSSSGSVTYHNTQ